ncbi:MAG TPA: DUF1800 domain-containing protein [Phycisphaerae bacterium]|nr:DUF1800 domain-containing protein [Phycisphaerae bacterium]
MSYTTRLLCYVAITLMTVTGCTSSEPGAGGSGSNNGGGLFGGNNSSGGDGQSLAKHSDQLTSDEAYHLLRRAAFGATPEQVEQAVQRGLTATVEDLLEKKPVPAEWDELAELYEDNIPRRWMVYLLESPNPLYEKMALFWHDRFATSRRVVDGRDRNLAVLHWNMLRQQALGNYREFLEELTIDPLMLIWLDGANSPKDNPNENYAREFWELFTLGRDVLYTEDDIKESTKAFTGITLLRESEKDARPIYDLLNHDTSVKRILPTRVDPGDYDYLGMIDLTLDQPEAARYVAHNLFVAFVHENPSDAVVNDLAQTFVDSNFEIEPVVRRLLTSQAMFSSDAIGSHITSPVEHVVGVFRTLDMHMYSEDSQGYTLNRLCDDLAGAGQEMLNPPGVEGWTEGEAWLEDQWLINRISALSRKMEFGPDRTTELPYHLLPAVGRWTEREIREEIVDAVASWFHLDLTEEEKDIYIEVLDQNGWRAFHLLEPDDQPRHVAELIRLMAMHENVITS